MKYFHYKLVISSIFIFIIGMNLGTSLVSHAHEGNEHNIAPSSSTWKLLDWNEGDPLIWYGKNVNITASIGSLLIYNVTQENKNNFTHPNSGSFSFGNASNYETDNNEIAQLLTFSIYPWSPGLITNANNWTRTISEATTIAEESPWLKGNLIVDKNYEYIFNGTKINSVRFDFVQDSPGNQNTTLIYDSEIGLLLYGYSEILISNLYKIELQLESSTLITIPVNSSKLESSTLTAIPTNSSKLESNTLTTIPTNSPGFEIVTLVLGIIVIIFIKGRNKEE